MTGLVEARMPLWVVLLGAAVAGCMDSGPLESIGGEDGPAPVPHARNVTAQRLPMPDVDFSTAIDPDHGGVPDGHAIAALHTGRHGLDLVGYNPLTRPTDPESPAGQDSGYIAADVWEHYVCVAHFIGTGGATLVDINDPARPTVVSSVESGMLNSDCQFTDDGEYLILAAYLGVTEGVPGVPPPLGDAAAYGVEVWDVRIKTKPVFLFHDVQHADGNSYHNVFTAKINGTNYVFQSYGNQIFALDAGATELRPVATLEAGFGHDLWVGRHPVTGEWVLVGSGPRVYNLDDPARPAERGAWNRTQEEDRLSGWHRMWPLTDLVDGRAYMVVAGETGEGGTLPYSVLDWTDPSDIYLAGTWEIPGSPVSPAPNFYTLGPHEFETWDGYVITGNYHAGVWIFDIGSPERAASPVTIAYYLPHEIPQAALGTTNKPFAFNPDVWGAYVDDRGYVVTADWGTGLYVLRFDATRTGR